MTNMPISWHVEAMAVSPSHQRRGVCGRGLMEAAVYLADVDNVPIFAMTVGAGLRDSLARSGFVCVAQNPLLAHGAGKDSTNDDSMSSVVAVHAAGVRCWCSALFPFGAPTVSCSLRCLLFLA